MEIDSAVVGAERHSYFSVSKRRLDVFRMAFLDPNFRAQQTRSEFLFVLLDFRVFLYFFFPLFPRRTFGLGNRRRNQGQTLDITLTEVRAKQLWTVAYNDSHESFRSWERGGEGGGGSFVFSKNIASHNLPHLFIASWCSPSLASIFKIFTKLNNIRQN